MSFAPMATSRLGLGFSSTLRQSLRSTRVIAPPSQQSSIRSIALSARHGSQSGSSSGQQWTKYAGMSALGLGLMSAGSVWQRPVRCEEGPSRPYATNSPSPSSNPPPESIVNVYQLSFGTLCGLCAGIFIKKGLKFIAFILGGGFVLLQYLSSQRLISVNWGSIGKRYDAVVERAAGPGDKDVKYYKGSTAARLWSRITDFLTANFQERASLLAGLALGLRIG